jgi:hypothetical protein
VYRNCLKSVLLAMNNPFTLCRNNTVRTSIAFLSLVIITCYTNLFAQDANPLLPTVKLSGFVKTDVFYDSRQTVSAREGHFLLFPASQVYDTDGKDINAKPNFNILPIQSNLSVSIAGPTALGAALSGLIEGDFFGQSNADVNMLRLRHAYLKMHWTKTELLIGQYWHPLFATSCYPGTVSFNTGVPIQPFSRAPQIRISHTIGLVKLSGALLSQRDYVSTGPDGSSSKYLRDSGIPEIQVSGELNIKKNNEFVFGTGFGYKRLTPQIKTGKNFKTNETVRGMSANAYLKHISKYLTIKLEGVYLENGSEFLSISGYAVKDSVDAEKGLVNYQPIRTLSCWGDIQTNGKLIQVGVFSGYTQNLGTKSEVLGPVYLTSNAPIKSLYRISPRLTVKPGNLMLAAEIEYTSALYGTPDNHCKMINTTKTDNIRFLLSAIFKF